VPLALIGGEEFSDGFEPFHARLAHDLIAHRSNGRELRVAFLPSCAADDGAATIEHWCRTAEARLSTEGVRVRSLPIADRERAADAELVGWLQQGALPHAHTLVGLDEQTLIVNTSGAWEVLGRGRARIVDPAYHAYDFVHGERTPASLLAGVSQ